MTVRPSHQEGLANRAAKPVSLTASRQLIDGDSAVFLPRTGGAHRRGADRVSLQDFAKLTAPLDQASKVGLVGLNLCPQAFIHRSRLRLFAGIRGGGATSLVARIRELLTVRGKHANFFSRKWFGDWTSIYHGLRPEPKDSRFTATRVAAPRSRRGGWSLPFAGCSKSPPGNPVAEPRLILRPGWLRIYRMINIDDFQVEVDTM